MMSERLQKLLEVSVLNQKLLPMLSNSMNWLALFHVFKWLIALSCCFVRKLCFARWKTNVLKVCHVSLFVFCTARTSSASTSKASFISTRPWAIREYTHVWLHIVDFKSCLNCLSGLQWMNAQMSEYQSARVCRKLQNQYYLSVCSWCSCWSCSSKVTSLEKAFTSVSNSEMATSTSAQLGQSQILLLESFMMMFNRQSSGSRQNSQSDSRDEEWVFHVFLLIINHWSTCICFVFLFVCFRSAQHTSSSFRCLSNYWQYLLLVSANLTLRLFKLISHLSSFRLRTSLICISGRCLCLLSSKSFLLHSIFDSLFWLLCDLF